MEAYCKMVGANCKKEVVEEVCCKMVGAHCKMVVEGEAVMKFYSGKVGMICYPVMVEVADFQVMEGVEEAADYSMKEAEGVEEGY